MDWTLIDSGLVIGLYMDELQLGYQFVVRNLNGLIYPIINIMLNGSQQPSSKKEKGQRFCFDYVEAIKSIAFGAIGGVLMISILLFLSHFVRQL